MKEVCINGHKILVPFLASEKMKTFPEISEDDISKLNEAVEKFTAAKTYAARQVILDNYLKSINVNDAAGGFYRSILAMSLNLRRVVYNPETL